MTVSLMIIFGNVTNVSAVFSTSITFALIAVAIWLSHREGAISVKIASISTIPIIQDAMNVMQKARIRNESIPEKQGDR